MNKRRESVSPKKVIIVFTDGSYSVREYPSVETARYHAGVACVAYPTAAVRVGDRVLQQGQSVDAQAAPWASAYGRSGTSCRLRRRITA